MKRYGDLWKLICSRENIEEAFHNAFKNKTIDDAKRNILDNYDFYVSQIQNSLINKTYKFSPLKRFVVYEPKERIINYPPFYPDCIYHHCLMNVIRPILMEKFTNDTYGSLRNRGVTLAIERLKETLHSHQDWYYLQTDCKKFYDSIDHDVCKLELRRIIKCQDTLKMIDDIIDVHDKGLAIGIYPSQYFANIMMCRVDHFVKEKLRIAHYYRYMDDIIMILPNKKKAHKVLKKLAARVSQQRLTIKPNYRIAPVSVGIDFLGYKLYPTHTLLRKRIKLKMQRNVRKLLKKNVDDASFKQKTASHFGWCIHADTYNLINKTFGEKLYLFKKNMDEHYRRLSEIKQQYSWFGLDKTKRLSIKSLYNTDIIVIEFFFATLMGENKIVVKFAYSDKPDEYHYFITKAIAVMDQIKRNEDNLPFVCQVVQITNKSNRTYTTIR